MWTINETPSGATGFSVPTKAITFSLNPRLAQVNFRGTEDAVGLDDFLSAVAERVRELLSTDAAAQRAERVAEQLAEAERAEGIGRETVAEIDARRRRLELEAPADLAAKLIALASRREKAEAEAEQASERVQALRPVLDGARASARRVLTDTTEKACRELLGALNARRAELVGRLSAAVGSLLDDLLAVELAQQQAMRPSAVEPEVARRLRQPPKQEGGKGGVPLDRVEITLGARARQ